ncbi:MAG: hypothetical protein ACT4PO_00645 [Actinomycetota bacterium]
MGTSIVGAAGSRTAGERGRRADLLAVGALATALLAFFLAPFVVRDFGFPLGPDGPVYLWWVRLAALDGLSAVGRRPGLPALALTLAGTLHISSAAVLAGLECALGTCVGLGAAALTKAGTGSDRRGRAVWILSGVLAGTFAVHLAAGYLANLAFAALFLAAAALLAMATKRATTAAAALLAAAGLAHPLFFLLGLAILALTAVLAFRAERASGLALADGEVGRIASAAGGGGALLGAGLLALLAGPAPLDVDTSKDAFLRRAGLAGDLRSAYLDRILRHWTRYVQWASIPLAVAGLRPAEGAVGRLLRAWAIVLVAGVVAALATGWAPPDRFVAFGYVIPILAALGLGRLWRALHPRRLLAALATGTLFIAMLLGAAITWSRQEPFISPEEVAAVTEAGRFAAAADPGTPLIFIVNDDDDSVTFLATRAANVIRAALPPDRIRDAFVYVGTLESYRAGHPTLVGDPQRDALSRLYMRDITNAAEGGPPPVAFVLEAFDRPDAAALRGTATEFARGVFLVDADLPPADPPVNPLRPSSGAGIAAATLASFGLLTALGYGWSRAAVGSGLAGAALAPAFGAAGLIVVAIALERLGVPLGGSWGPTLVSALIGAGGCLLAFLLKRDSVPDPAPEI